MTKPPARRRNKEAGQALLIAGLVLVVLMMAAGLSIDMGYLRYERRLAQTAADSAAIAGATCNGNPVCQSNTVQVGQAAAGYNGFTDGAAQTTVTIGPPTSGPHVGYSNYVEAIVTQNIPTFFMKIFGPAFSSFPVKARAVAYPGPGNACLYALGSLTLGGPGNGFNPSLEAGQCAAYIGGNLTIYSNAPFATTGTVYGNTYPTQSSGAVPIPIKGAPVGDPLGSLATNPPSLAGAVPGCGYDYCAGSYPSASYPSGIQVTGSATFQPGVYVLGNGLSISPPTGGGGPTPIVTGTGVTFFVTGGQVSINSGSSYGTCGNPMTQNIGSTVRLSAPTDTSQPFPGILFIQSGNQSGDITINDGDDCSGNQGTTANASYLWGVLYFPNAQLSLTGTGLDADNQCSNLPRFTSAIASDLLLYNQINFGVTDCGGVVTPYIFSPPLPDPVTDGVLVE